ncbi:MAG: hypothetical protein AAF744_02820 [Pseudomonadota bacterium]
MSEKSDTLACKINCLAVAGVAGFVLAVLMVVIGDWDWTPSLFVGAIAAAVLGLVLAVFVCAESTAKADLEAVRKGEKGAAAAKAAALAEGATTPGDISAAPAPTAAAVPAASATAAASTATPTPAPEVGAQPGESPEGEMDKGPSVGKEGPLGEDPAPADTAAADSGATETSETPVAESEPEILSAPQGSADDLKRISGVGPKLEGVLNDLGFWHFWQIAAWGPEEVAWVDTRLKFKGRIERDNWIDQAKAFAAEAKDA